MARTGSTRSRLTGPTAVAALENGSVRPFEITPEQAGLTRAGAEALRAAMPRSNADALRAVLEGKPGAYPRLRAAQRRSRADRRRPREGSSKRASRSPRKSIDSGAALQRLDATDRRSRTS